MKQIYILLVALAAMCFTGCSKDDDDDDNVEGVITMVAEEKEVYFWVDSFKEGETITIDWGDEVIENVVTFADYDDDDDDDEFWGYTWNAEHSYVNNTPHTITIKGNIKALYCGTNNFTTLDVSKNTALTELYCDDNNLSTLDVSKNTALTKLYCSYNKLSASALNQIFNDLPQGSDGHIEFYANPGSKTCNKSIAENKGWRVL